MTKAMKYMSMSGAALLLILLSAQASAQAPALYKAIYDFTFVEDTTMREQPLRDEMVLYMNTQASLYRRASEEESEYSRFVQSGGVKDNFNINSILDVTASLFQELPTARRINTERIVREMYQIDETLSTITWEIQSETKKIGGFEVQLALGKFGGRDYEAWFAPEIPFPFGPWKLHGLPGLILEARDSRNDILFNFKSFAQVEGQPVHVVAPEDIRKIAMAEYERIYRAFRENPAAFIRGTAGSSNVRVAGGTSTSVGSSMRQRGYNNPMELR